MATIADVEDRWFVRSDGSLALNERAVGISSFRTTVTAGYGLTTARTLTLYECRATCAICGRKMLKVRPECRRHDSVERSWHVVSAFSAVRLDDVCADALAWIERHNQNERELAEISRCR
jgi:hypothetical protein